jgi:hypothetical protein
MAQNKTLDPKLTEQLQQHYAVNPRSGFLPALKSKLIGRFPVQRPARHKGRKLAYGLISAAIVLLIVLFATPIGRVLAQEFVELFQRAESNAMPNYPEQTAIARDATRTATDPTHTPEAQTTQTPDPTSKEYADLTIEEVEQLAGFDVLAPTYLPLPLEFYGANYDPETNIVHLFYDGGMEISQEPITGMENCDLCSEIGPAARIQTVQVGESEGKFVIGVWKMDDDGNRHWTGEPWLQRLRWHTDDSVFEILLMGRPGKLLKKDLLEIAESFQ